MELCTELSGRNILITGGGGFIGSNLAIKLTQLMTGKVFVIDNLALEKNGGRQRGLKALQNIQNNKLKLIIGDVSNYKFMLNLLKKEEIDIVFNLAALPLPLGLKRPKYVFDKNVKIVSVLAELQRLDLFKVFIHFSSSEVYGSAIYIPIDENHPLLPSTAYGSSKAAQDLLLLSYYKTYGNDIRVIRPFNNLGKYQNDFAYSAVIPRTIRRIMENKMPEVFGDGLQTRDYIYVEDTCEAAIKIAVSKGIKGEVINVGSGKEVRIVDLIKLICELMGYKGGILYKPERPGDVRRHICDISKAKRLINFKPKVSLRDALKIVINWYSKVIREEKNAL